MGELMEAPESIENESQADEITAPQREQGDGEDE